MNLRTFVNTGIHISEVGLGTWQLGGDWGKVDDTTALGILYKAADMGVTFIDTADVYGNGRSEQMIGKFLRETDKEIFVATKIGRSDTPGWPRNFTLEAMRGHVENSLKRLGLEALDLVQLHCIPTDVLRNGEIFDYLRTLVREGKIKHFGVSVESMEEADMCLAQSDLTSLQIIFNIFRQKPIESLFDKAKARQVAIIARIPLASGLLSGKLSIDTHFSRTDHRNFNKDGESFNVGETFAGLPYEKGVEFANTIKPFVPEGMTMSQMALRWILDFDAVTTVIPGASKLSQVESNISVSTLPPLSPELHTQLSELYNRLFAPYIRGPY
jgi:aryl-alcohol dehydrogenase-like predicted oxidoreductase